MKMISWNLTRNCNLHCDHCYRDAGPDAGNVESELSTEEGIELLDELKKESFMLVIMSGGEPLMRDDLEELVDYASDIGLRPVLGTNAVDVSRERLESLKKAGLKGAAVSLDSVDPTPPQIQSYRRVRHSSILRSSYLSEREYSHRPSSLWRKLSSPMLLQNS